MTATTTTSTPSTISDNNLETFSLIWLDANVNSSEENIETQHRLRAYINHVKTFEDPEECKRHILSLLSHDRLALIVSGRLGYEVVSCVHQLRQVSLIYIYCLNKKKNEEWAKEFSKIRGVIVELDELVNRIRLDLVKEQQTKVDEPLLISVFTANLGSERSTTGLNGQFIHSQLLVDCFLRMQPTEDDTNELVSFCRDYYQDNRVQLDMIDEFEQYYSSNKSLWWYTRDSFLYRLLNKSLRVQNIYLLFLFRFVICDLGQQLKKYRCTFPMCLYRGQLMTKEELQILKDSTGEFISMNSFLSTSVDRKCALLFLPRSVDLERVLFEINADPRLDNIKAFANITPFSEFPKEQEVLIMLGSIFRLIDIYRDTDGVWIIRMNLCSDNDHILKSVFDYLRKDYGGGDEKTNMLSFCNILLEMGKLDEAEKYFHRLLERLPQDHKDVNRCFYALGIVTSKKGNFDESLHWHKKALDKETQTTNPSHLHLARSYNCIGNVYRKQGDLQRALKMLLKALAIYEKIEGEDQVGVAWCLANIGNVYQREKNYQKALEYHLKSLPIRQKHLPANHPHLGASHYNLATAYRCLGNSNLALKHANVSLNISQKSLPLDHPNIAWALENIGYIYEDIGDLAKALSYLEKSTAIYHETLPSTHPYIADVESSIRRISSQLN